MVREVEAEVKELWQTIHSYNKQQSSLKTLAIGLKEKIDAIDEKIKESPYTRLCQTKNILTVNSEFPGPTIQARKGDTVVVKVHNHAEYNVTLHWHGVDQLRNPWFDGTEYITQCPIKPGTSFTYRIQFNNEEGTLWWHAHSSWDRATVHGAIVIHPKKGSTFPFPKPHKEIPIVLGEWWSSNVRQVIGDALRTGGIPNQSDAYYTINGQPGDLYPFSKSGTFTTVVKHGKRYLLRVINAAINNEFFFAVAGHQLTVVGTDASYTKPWTNDYVQITPGQTMDLWLEANQPAGRYYMVATAYASSERVPFTTTATTAILEYVSPKANPSSTPHFPYLPDHRDTSSATKFTAGLRSLASKHHPVDVSNTIDERILITIALNMMECPGRTCQGIRGTWFATSLNNISFVNPSTDVLQAYY